MADSVTVSVSITNIDQIQKAFKQAPDLMSAELNDAIKKSLFAIQSETILNVHPDRGINIITGGLLAATERPPTFTMLKGVYDINISYAIFVHQGTRFMKARPFLKNAAESKNKAINSFFTAAVNNVLSQIGKDV